MKITIDSWVKLCWNKNNWIGASGRERDTRAARRQPKDIPKIQTGTSISITSDNGTHFIFSKYSTDTNVKSGLWQRNSSVPGFVLHFVIHRRKQECRSRNVTPDSAWNVTLVENMGWSGDRGLNLFYRTIRHRDDLLRILRIDQVADL